MIKKNIFISFYLIIIIISLEVIIRYFWGGPIEINEQKWEKFNVDLDSIVGYKCKKGKNIYTNTNKEYEVNCSENGRITSSILDNNTNKQELYFYGCSFTFGHGLPDSLTFTWRIQKMLPTFKIYNLAYEGYGVSQFYAQITNQLKLNTQPTIIIINYASFHDGRNLLLRTSRRDAYYYQQDKTILNRINFPILLLKNDNIILEYSRFNYDYAFPFVTKMALFNFIDVTISKILDKIRKPNKISIEAFKDLDKKCKEKNITLIINGIIDDLETRKTLEILSQSNIITTNIFVDLKNKNLLFEDNFHPNEVANEKLSLEFVKLISDIKK